MSQASRSHVEARARHREQVARWIDETVGSFRSNPSVIESGNALGWRGEVGDLLSGEGRFDVHAVRTFAQRELDRAEADLVELSVFTDWTRERGRGPENRDPYEFRACRDCGSSGDRDGCGAWLDCEDDAIGGWPGNLAREYARLGLGRADIVTAPARARVARRVLDALAGQPSYCVPCMDGCANCGGSSGSVRIVADDGEWFCSVECEEMHDDLGCPLEVDRREQHRRRRRLGRPDCSHCRGTGHNLRGTLPPLVASPAVRRRRADQGLVVTGERSRETWLDDPAVTGHMGPGWAVFLREREDPESGSRLHSGYRVVERGRHRDDHERWPECEQWDSDLDTRINGRGWFPWSSASIGWRQRGTRQSTVDELRPRWRRGELRHGKRRQERALRIRQDEWSIEVGPSPSDR